MKNAICKGIIAFRKLCGLDASDNYDEYVNIIHKGLTNRLKYRHHYLLPPEERMEPYSLMISYDRHSPYAQSWAGFFCDVIETFCYHKQPNFGYSESVAETTNVYRTIVNLGPKATSLEIHNAIKNENFTIACNEFFNKPGGYLVPYIFFILRNKIRNDESFANHKQFIEKIKNVFPEALDQASIFIGGFFGYNKFYEDYYTSLNLPFIKSLNVSNQQEETSIPESLASDSLMNHPQQTLSLEDAFSNGCSLFNELFNVICESIENKNTRKPLLKRLEHYREDESMLKDIKAALLSPTDNKDVIKNFFSLSRFTTATFNKIAEYYKQILR